ncbi:MAG: EamA family transporter [Lewinellaceae bacterium]|nr:EamA family transporter [Lewinellaceae bacterium]
MRQPAALDWFLMFVLATVWGASFIMIKRSVVIFTPEQMAAWRMVLATVIYIPIAAMFWSKIDWKRWRPLLGVAFFGSAIPNFFFAVAQRHVTSSLAGILNTLAPFFTLLIGAVFFQTKFTSNKILGVLIGLGGAIFLIMNNSSSSASGNFVFALFCVLATVCYALNANIVQTYLRDMHPAAIASAAFMLAGGFFIATLWWSSGWQAAFHTPDGMKGLGYVLYLSAVGTVGGSILYFWLLQRTSALFATSVTYLLPVTAILVGFLDGEPLAWTDFFGAAIILTGVYLARK